MRPADDSGCGTGSGWGFGGGAMCNAALCMQLSVTVAWPGDLGDLPSRHVGIAFGLNVTIFQMPPTVDMVWLFWTHRVRVR